MIAVDPKVRADALGTPLPCDHAPSSGAQTAAAWLVTLQPAGENGAKEANLLLRGRSRSLQLQLAGSGVGPDIFVRRGCCLVVDGLLSNRDELRRQLSLLPTVSNAAILHAGYLRWGMGVLERARGEFALCLFDGDADVLVAARDRIGHRPLFVLEEGATTHLTSTLEAFGAPTGPGLRLDTVEVANYLLGGAPALERTLYQGVTRIPPAHAVRVDAFGRSVVRFWNPLTAAEIDGVREIGGAGEIGGRWRASAPETIEHFHRLFERAVARAFEQGAPALLLSGGIDSVAVAVTMADIASRLGVQPPTGLALILPGPMSEEETQRGVAAELGMPLLTLEVGDQDGELLQEAVRTSAGRSAPLRNIWQPALDRLQAQAAERGCSVVLSGSGGDEWLTPSPLVAADLVRSLDLGALLGFAAAFKRSNRLSWSQVARGLLWQAGLRPLLVDWRQNLLDNPSLALWNRHSRAREQARALASIPPWLALEGDRLEQLIGKRSEASRRLAATARTAGSYEANETRLLLEHPQRALEFEARFESGRRLGMSHIDPFWDEEVAEHLSRVTPHLLNRNGMSKGIVRERVAARFTGMGFERQKKLAWGDYHRSLIAGSAAAAWQELGGAAAGLEELGVVHGARFDRYMSELIASGGPAGADRIWRLLSLESWVRPRVWR